MHVEIWANLVLGSHRLNDETGSQAQFFDNSQDLEALLELRDIQDELNTIKKLLIEQHKTVRDMTRQFEDIVNRRGKGIHGTLLLKEAEHAIGIYEERVESMLMSSQVAENAVSSPWLRCLTQTLIEYSLSNCWT